MHTAQPFNLTSHIGASDVLTVCKLKYLTIELTVMTALSLSGLYIYPIKSAAGIAVREAKLTRRGLEYDRRWMVVDGQGKFLTQRRFPRMALISVAVGESLRVRGPRMPDLEVPLVSEGKTVEVEVWGDHTFISLL